MSSGEKILSVIREDSEQNVRAIKAESETKCSEILEKGRAKCKEIMDAAERKKAEQTAKLEKARRSRVELEKRNAVLKAKRNEINKAVDAAVSYMSGLDDKAYFELIYKLAATLGKKEGVVLLNSRDLKRAPADFNKRIQQAGLDAKLSDTPDNSIKSGFILKNGDIEENMSFAAIVASRREAVEDLINRELFRG